MRDAGGVRVTLRYDLEEVISLILRSVRVVVRNGDQTLFSSKILDYETEAEIELARRVASLKAELHSVETLVKRRFVPPDEEEKK